MISIEQLKFAYPGGEFRLSIPELRVDAGETLAIVGPSGSGKSTLLNLIAGVLRPADGQVIVDETEVSALSDRRCRAYRAHTIGFVFQDFGLLDYLTAGDNILHPYRICGALRLTGDVRTRADTLAKRLGVADFLHRRPEALSHGERQRVAICRALLPMPRVILADEATGNLDPDNKSTILGLLFDAVRNEGSTLVAVTHDHELLPRFDRVADFSEFTGATL
jgi:putative ABC transport system ATP-binding protein